MKNNTESTNSTHLVLDKALRRVETTLKHINDVQAAIERELGLKRAQDELRGLGIVRCSQLVPLLTVHSL